MIRRIRPTREVAPGLAAEVPKAPSHPSRIWVQLATGRDKAALFALDMKTRESTLLAADDEADDGAVGAVKLSLNSLNHLNDLSEGAPW